MSSLQDLDDPTKTCIYLAPRDDVAPGSASKTSEYPSPFPSRDLDGGYALRLKIYQQTWEKCLNRVQSIVHELHAPTVSSVVAHVQNAYANHHTLPGLPYPELPVITVSGGMSVIANIIQTLEDVNSEEDNNVTSSRHGKNRMVDEDEDDVDTGARILLTHVHPADCSNLMSAMRTIITGFVDRPADYDDESEDEDAALRPIKRKATASLANYDINLLESWYASMHEAEKMPPQLVVVIYEFEQIDVNVMQDVFYICSQHIPRLPLVFLLALSSPSSPSYLHTAFTRETLALLRVHAHVARSGSEIIEEIITKTFFDIDFDSDIMLGPATLDYLNDFSTRHTASVDAMLTILQLAYLKHFEEPLTVFTQDTLLGTHSQTEAVSKLEQPSSFNFLDSLLTRIWSDASSHDSSNQQIVDIDWRSPTIPTLLTAVTAAHTESRKHVQRMRLGFQALRLVQRFMRAKGYKTSISGKEDIGLELMSKAVRGRLNKDLSFLGLMVKKLSASQLDALLAELYQFFQSIASPQIRREEEDARVRIVTASSQLPREAVDREDDENTPAHPAVTQIAASLGDWLIEYVEDRVVKLDQGILWDVWNTGMTPFPSELINPAPRITIINALLRPYDFIDAQKELFGSHSVSPADEATASNGKDHMRHEPALWELPDTSILFRRYMDAGRMINVYDWYQSFAHALDTQKYNLRKKRRRSEATGVVNGSPRKGKGKEKEKAHAVELSEEEEGNEETEEEQEKWRIEVQARFMRSLHELDLMGFIKHTGRKPDHVIKTTYDLPD